MQDIGGSVSQLPVPSSAMLTVWRLSGQELAARSAEEFTDAASLKKHLYDLYGFPIYLQQLVHRDRLLSDEARLDGAMDLQLVLKSVLGAVARFQSFSCKTAGDCCRRGSCSQGPMLAGSWCRERLGQNRRHERFDARIQEWSHGGRRFAGGSCC